MCTVVEKVTTLKGAINRPTTRILQVRVQVSTSHYDTDDLIFHMQYNVNKKCQIFKIWVIDITIIIHAQRAFNVAFRFLFLAI